ncbi:MAG: hypothetical protein PVG65_00490 [Candidatus Thorarchaeota archaeon]|jgi:hypothetical protein
MKLELQQILFKKYPKIFRQKNLPMTETCMCWGIETPDSWYPILDCLCWKIQLICDKGISKYVKYPFGNFLSKLFRNPKLYGRWVTTPVKQVEATQVKEKFGTLRFYTTGSNNVIDSLIDMAEAMTSQVCAKCGSYKNVKATKVGWIVYLCEDCYPKENKK